MLGEIRLKNLIDKYKGNKKVLYTVAAVVIVVVLLGGSGIYRSYQSHRAVTTVNKIYSSTGALSRLSKSFNVKVDAKDQTINLYPQENIKDQINENIENYYESHVSTLSRLMGEDDEYGTYGKMSVTESTIEPMCYAISSSNTYLKDWKINVYGNEDGSDVLLYSYQNSHFTSKIEDKLDKLVAQGQEVHDQNAADILKAALDASND